MKRTKRLSIEQQALLERLVRRRYALFMNVADKLLGNTMSAEDAVQSTLLLAAEHIERLEGLSFEQQTAYLVRMVQNNARSMLKKKTREAPWGEDVREALLSFRVDRSKSAYQARELSKELKEALLLLHQKYREVICLYYFYERSLDEIGLLLGESKETVRTRLRRGKQKLRAAVPYGTCGQETGRACRSLGCISPLSVVQYHR